VQEDCCWWSLDRIVSQELGYALIVTRFWKLSRKPNTLTQNTCCRSHTINNTTTERDCGGLRDDHGYGVENCIQYNQGFQFSQHMATTRRRAHQLLHGWPHSIDTMRWMIPLGRPVQPGSKPVLRLLRCDSPFARNPAERYLIMLRQFCFQALIQYSTSLYEDTGERWVFKSRLKQDPRVAHLVPFPRRPHCDLAARYSSVAYDRWVPGSPLLHA
jgi:hypothetical protein